ncbi:MAG: hypothetical protein AAB691_01700 [Patescibacteria group bacterium]
MYGNYEAWEVKIEDFPESSSIVEQLRFLLRFAVLAPSSHNSQPWSFKIEGNSIFVFPEKSRRLPESDKNDRQLYISLGCAIENILVAADYYGFQTSVEYLLPNDCATKITLTRMKEEKKENHLIFSIPLRVNNRNQYDEKLLDPLFIEKLKSFETDDQKISVVLDKKEMNDIADVVLDAGVAAMDDPNFRLELSHYVKPNTTRSKVGMPGFGLGIPTPVSFIVPTLLKWVNVNRLSRKQDEALLKQHTPAFVLISTKQDTSLDWMKAGQAFESIALEAQRSGLKTAVWAAPIQIGEFYKKLQGVLKIDFRPQVFFRLGYTNKVTRHSPRMMDRNVI